MTSIDKMLKLTRGQGHGAKAQGHMCKFVFFFDYILRTNDCTLMILKHMIDINKMLKLT